MASKEWFRDWFSSPFYHKLYFGHGEAEARHFIGKLLDYLQPAAGSRMLDVACGRGRHSRLLAGSGFDVTGFDLSFESIMEAQKWESDRLHFYQHDMRLPFWINYFHFAFNFFTSFGYFATDRENNDAVRTIAGSLLPGGTVTCDFLNVHYAEEHLVKKEEKKIEDTVYTIHRHDDEQWFYKDIRIEDPSLYEPVSYTEKVAKLNLGDFTEMLSLQKMQITQVFGDYDLNPYDIRKTPRLIVMAKKASLPS